MKNSNAQIPGYHSSKKQYFRENGTEKPNRRNHSTEKSKSKKSHGRSHQRSKPGFVNINYV